MGDTYNKMRIEALNFMEEASSSGKLTDVLITYKVMKRFGFSKRWCEEQLTFLEEVENDKDKLRHTHHET
jgi:hypothetical protein